ncbi:MAG: hypoxanthine phosphoribosyltransferase [Planctomycetales bacterium]
MKQLLSETQIQTRIAALASDINADYRGRPLTVVGTLMGSLMFLADLVRRLDGPLQWRLVRASSYRGAATTPGELQIDDSHLSDLTGRDVLLLDDILDTGQTLAALVERLQQHQPRSLRTAVLLWKRDRQLVPIEPDYHGFLIPDLFVVGYGLDHQEDYRHLPYVAHLEPQDLD